MMFLFLAKLVVAEYGWLTVFFVPYMQQHVIIFYQLVKKWALLGMLVTYCNCSVLPKHNF